MNQYMYDDQRQPSLSSQSASSHSRGAFLLGLLGGLVPFLLAMLAASSQREDTGLIDFISAVAVELLATLLLVILAPFERTRPVAYGLFLPCVIAACFETFGHFTYQPITPCTSVLLLLAAVILFVSWRRKRTSDR